MKPSVTVSKSTLKVHPRVRANIFSKVFFCWAFPIFFKGFKTDLTEDDLYEPLRVHESKRLGDKLEKVWLEETRKEKPSLWKVILNVFGKEIALFSVVPIFMELISKISHPILLKQLLEYYEPGQNTVTKKQAYLYASAIVAVSLLNVLIIHSYMLGLQHLGMKIRVACCSLIYRKALRLSRTAMAETTVGQMVNLLSNDVKRFELTFMHFNNLWIAPIETIVIMYLLYTTVGVTAMAGVGILALFIPIQMYMGKKSSTYRMSTALKTDQRVRLMNEIISGIQVIKMYTWEKPFTKLVEKARKNEIHEVKAASYLRAVNVSFTIFLNRVSIFMCVLAYVFSGNALNASYVYVVTSFYAVLRHALTIYVPHGVMTLAESNISIKRIKKFLMYDEIRSQSKTITNGHGIVKTSPAGIHIQGAYAKWTESSNDYTLKGVDFEASQGQLVAIVGTVGSGKTTLLNVILKELNLDKGTLEFNGTISYASQEPWLYVGSIKDNILFGQEMDTVKYNEVVRVCALKRDFSLFPYGDQTVVGERGVMLSGGQKARINLARAVYKEADIYLLDDPLSAVDTHVGKQLFDECISGYLKNKCTVLVTHQLQYLRTVDKIYVMETGSVVTKGSYNDLSAGEFMKLLKNDAEETCVESDNVKKAESLLKLNQTDKPKEVEEQRGSGTISHDVYKSYFKAGGNRARTFFVLSLFFMAQGLASGTDYFLAYWVNTEQDRVEEGFAKNATTDVNKETLTPQICMHIYTTLVIILVVVTVTRSLSFFKYCMKASRVLHNNMFEKIVHASMWFFNTNPSGRILNRFSKDMGSIDDTLPLTISDTLQIGLNVLSITIVVCTVNHWIILPTIVLFIIFYFYRMFFLASSRSLKRLEGTTRSPVFSHLTASLQGLTTIRAFKEQKRLEGMFDHHQDLHSSAFYTYIGCTRTFGFWLDINCIVYIALVTLSFLFLGKETHGGNVGLAITQTITLTGMFQWGMRQWSELENQMTSVERVVEYTKISPEPDKDNAPAKDWPTEGNVEFRSLSMRYSNSEPLVLKNLNFRIQSKEKIGIVGRTGAGKSSLISALFRLCNTDGKILIDNVDTKNISLASLRSKISIIPQEPVLFSGTLRKNLDPFDEYNDENLWNALEQVELKVAISDLPHGLQSTVSDGGSNFSVGQRQLLCLARAVLKSNKILVLDEATANVDPQTDELIQGTIRKKFDGCTVLTIAHRLHTIMDSDKVLVMDQGTAVEFDHPYVLIQNQGVFYDLVLQTGKGMSDNLLEIAQKRYRK